MLRAQNASRGTQACDPDQFHSIAPSRIVAAKRKAANHNAATKIITGSQLGDVKIQPLTRLAGA